MSKLHHETPSFFEIQQGILGRTWKNKEYTKFNKLKKKLLKEGYRVIKYNSHINMKDGRVKFQVTY